MPKFMFVYRGPAGEQPEMSPEQMQQSMQKWMDWIGQGMKEGWMVEGGDALQQAGKVVRAEGAVTDGPFAESKELVGGFSMVQADDLAAAAELTKGCPVFAAGGSVEVRELMDVEIPDAK